MLEKLDDAVFPNDDIELDGIDIVTLISNGVGLNTIDLNINLDDDNFDEADLSNIDLPRLIALCNRLKQCKTCNMKN